MILQCTAGSIVVPIFLSSIPWILSQDSYSIAILVAFILHETFSFLREVFVLSPYVRIVCIILYEVYQSHLVVFSTDQAAILIQPSEFGNITIFAPILCGTLAGCGYVFLPLDAGLRVTQQGGFGQSIVSAFLAATFYHFFVHTTISTNIINVKEKTQVVISTFLIADNIYYSYLRVAIGRLAAKSKSE